MGNLIMQIFRGMKGSYAFQLLGKAFLRLRTAVMNPFQRVVRRVQQIFNVNIITSRLVAPINAKVRKILNGEAKSPEDYFTVGRFWISKMLVYFLILAGCAAVFIYFNWIAAPVSDTLLLQTSSLPSIMTMMIWIWEIIQEKRTFGQPMGKWSIQETSKLVCAVEVELYGTRTD